MPLQFQLLTTPLSLAQQPDVSYQEQFRALLSSDLNFHGQNSAYASHNFHAFPAKFPPQLPRKFIDGLTSPGDVVLDPMMGSGTTIVEAFLADRRGLGVDIDPLALRLCKVKVTPLDLEETARSGNQALCRAQESLQQNETELRRLLDVRFGQAERKFMDYWFLPSTQIELLALVREIERVQDSGVREFLELAFSAIIITKSGGVSLARDLAHTRPHRVSDKAPRSAISEYRKRLSKNLASLAELAYPSGSTKIIRGNAQKLPIRNEAVDLVVTSPPYASNAIDYMRAHKFSLVWLGHPLDSLTQLRQEYIGHDAVSGFQLAELSDTAHKIIDSIAQVDPKRAKSLHRYYSEMTHALVEMVRVLKPGKAAIIVVGSSTLCGIDTRTDVCLGEIGKNVGFELVGIATRALDRDRRMMPARRSSATIHSQIEERMHEEYVIGFMKPGRSFMVDGKRLRDISDLPFDLAI